MQIKTIAALSLLWVACKQPESAPAVASQADSSAVVAAEAAPDLHGYVPFYSSSFEVGDAKNVEKVMTMYRDYDEGHLSAHQELMADTFETSLADGSHFRGPRDIAVANVTNWRNTFSSATTTVASVSALRSIDKDEQWVIVWAKEVHTSKASGKADSIELQEAWRFDKEGKANWVLQYSRPAAPPK